MEKGIVMETRGDRATVLVRGGEFRDISCRGMAIRVGQEILLPEAVSPVSWWAALTRVRVAAVVAMVLVAVLMPVGYFQFIAPGPVLAYVSFDLNPSVEMGIDRNGRVLEATGVGPEGEALLAAVKWEKRKLDEVISDLVVAGEAKGYMKDAENSLLITLVPKDKEKEIPKGLEKKVAELPQAVKNNPKATTAPVAIKVIQGDKDLRDKARQLGITAGKAAVLIEAIDQGLKVQVEDLKTGKISKVVPNAGGKTEEVLKRASDRDKKSWSRLIDQHKEQIERAQKPPEPKKQDPPKDPKQDQRPATPSKPATPAQQPKPPAKPSAPSTKQGRTPSKTPAQTKQQPAPAKQQPPAQQPPAKTR